MPAWTKRTGHDGCFANVVTHTSWLFQRMQCAYCGNQDQHTISYFTSDDGRYRLYICEMCKKYLKAIDLRQAGEETDLPLERLLTLSIDLEAREYGYGESRPAINLS